MVVARRKGGSERAGRGASAGVDADSARDRRRAVAAIRREQAQLLRAIELLHARCVASADARIALELSEVRQLMQAHVGLVDAVLDVAVEDDLTPER